MWKTARTARKLRICPSCGRGIHPGDRYWEHVAAPNDNDLGNTHWWRLPECGACASRYGRPVPAAGGVS